MCTSTCYHMDSVLTLLTGCAKRHEKYPACKELNAIMPDQIFKWLKHLLDQKSKIPLKALTNLQIDWPKASLGRCKSRMQTFSQWTVNVKVRLWP